MEHERTNIFLSSSDGETIIDDFQNDNCLSCIVETIKSGKNNIKCPIDGINKKVLVGDDKDGCLYICDNKEKTSKNLRTLVDLIKHSRSTLYQKKQSIAQNIQRQVRKEVDSFKHNIEHINSDAINEFYTFLPQDVISQNYSKLKEIIHEAIEKDSDGAEYMIVRTFKYNQNIKTELSVISILDNPNIKLTYSLINPRDAIMPNIYALNYVFEDRNIRVRVNEYRDKHNLNYEVLRVATYYIIENATKYTEENTQFDIIFERQRKTLSIIFAMHSLYIAEIEENLIFDEGFKGEQARKTGKSGKGIGLNRSKRLINLCGGNLILEPGSVTNRGKDGLLYSDNRFIIEFNFK